MGRESSQWDCFPAKCLFQSLPESVKKALGTAIFSHTGPHLLCFVLIGDAVNQPCPAPAAIKLGSDNWVPNSAGTGTPPPAELNPHSQRQRLPQRSGPVQGRQSDLSTIKQQTLPFDTGFLFNSSFIWRAVVEAVKDRVVLINPLHG